MRHHGGVDAGEVAAAGHRADHRGSAPARELGGHRANRAEDALDQDGSAVDGAVGEHGAVRGDPGDAQAGAELVAEVTGQGHGQWPGTTAYWAAVPKGR